MATCPICTRAPVWISWVLAVVPTFACTAILAPRDDVQRCGSADDCNPTGDTRYVPECRFPEDSDLDPMEVDPICIAGYRPDVRCDPVRVPALQAAVDDRSDVTYCDPSAPATRGCSGELLGCADGLIARPDGICDVEERPDIPAYAYLGVADGVGDTVLELDEDRPQHVLDAYCQSFFCDVHFVCRGDVLTCAPCDPSAAFGEGGCGRFYSGPELACAYAPECDEPNAPEECRCGTQDPDDENFDPAFGDCS